MTTGLAIRRLAAVAIIAGGGALASPAADAESLPGDGVTATSVYIGITEELFQAYIIARGLQELGYQTTDPDIVQLPALHAAIAHGDITYYAAHWWPLHKAYWENNGGDANLQRVGTLARNSIQGYLIDKATADAHGITQIDQLKDPEIAQLFDISGDGRADLYGCEPGWGCERVIEHHLDAYDLRDTINHNQGSYFAIIADAIERIRSGQPTLYYTWTPQWISAVLRPDEDVSWLTVPYTAVPEEQEDAVTEVPGIGNLGFSVNTQHVIANTEFLEDNPAARRWFELLEIPIEDINAQNLRVHEGENSKEDIQRHVDEWVEALQDQWDAWIAEAKDAGS